MMSAVRVPRRLVANGNRFPRVAKTVNVGVAANIFAAPLSIRERNPMSVSGQYRPPWSHGGKAALLDQYFTNHFYR